MQTNELYCCRYVNLDKLDDWDSKGFTFDCNKCGRFFQISPQHLTVPCEYEVKELIIREET